MNESGPAKQFRHFKDPGTVAALVAEIKARHGCSYEALLDPILAQLQGYYERAFAGSRRIPPSRFGDAAPSQVRERFLVALSGGIDSAVVTYLAVRAVGREAVLPVTMPGRPDDESLYLAALVRAELHLAEPDAPYVIDLEPLVQAHMGVMTGQITPQVHLGHQHQEQTREQQMRSGNFASRLRVAVLSDLQRAIRGRILGTSNRTEYCQGYSTKFGTPISYDFGVLDELYKVDVYELGQVLGVPDAVLTTPPSTGYFAGQTHEGELGATIEEQDIFAYLLFERNLAPAVIAQEYGSREDFARVMQHRFDVSEHKRVLNGLQEHVRLARVPLRM
jgi:NAD+ synthase